MMGSEWCLLLMGGWWLTVGGVGRRVSGWVGWKEKREKSERTERRENERMRKERTERKE